MRALYRVRQGIENLRARITPEDLEMVRQNLSPEEEQLFLRMSAADQIHSVRVLLALQAEGVADQDLIKAALLHDVGKSRCHISVFHRTLAVLAAALLGRLPPLLAVAPQSGSWWFPFYVIVNHPRIGAAMLARTGCPERVWRLAELHHLEPRQVGRLPADNEWIREALLTLRRADNRN